MSPLRTRDFVSPIARLLHGETEAEEQERKRMMEESRIKEEERFRVRGERLEARRKRFKAAEGK